MKLRIISDVHCDVNKDYSVKFDFGDDFVICCGDVSGDRITTKEWIDKNIKNGIIISGNHLGYNEVTFDEKDTLDYSIKYLQECYNSEPIYFLENQSVEIDDVIFVGCMLFTDFKLFNNEEYCKVVASRGLNDFKYVKVSRGNEIELITTMYQQQQHTKSLKYIESVCAKNPDKKIVVITHHAPSYKSVPVQFKNSMVSAAYASNLESTIQKYDNLKLWCHGHMHESCHYELFGTRIVCNPLGYFDENPYFKPDGVFIDTDEL